MVFDYEALLGRSMKTEMVKQENKIKQAVKTFNHCCGRKKNSYIRYCLRGVGCSVPSCRVCGKTPKSTNKSKGTKRNYNRTIQNEINEAI